MDLELKKSFDENGYVVVRGLFSPKKIEPAAEEVIGEVVASRDGGKHGADAGALAVDGDCHGLVGAVLSTGKAYHMLSQRGITAANSCLWERVALRPKHVSSIAQ